MTRKLGILLLLASVLASCAGASMAAPSPSSAATIPASQLGPGGLTLDEEIGAVIMVGFQGTLTDAVVADWRQRQFGGLLVINLNRNAGSGADVADLINALRGVSRHRLIAATDQEGGAICLDVSSVPCAPMPVGNAETTRMAQALRGLGFDLDLGPVSDVCSGPSSIM